MLNDIKQTSERLKALLDTHIKEYIEGIQLPANIGKIYIIASGSSRNAANAAKYFIEKVAKIPVIVDFAGEFAHRSPVVSQNDLLISLSQSGETADVLAALKKGKEMGMNTFAITNNPESTIHKLSDSSMAVQAGEEESIPATKSFTCQLMSLYLFGLYLAQERKKLTAEEIEALKEKLLKVPELISQSIESFKDGKTLTEGILRRFAPQNDDLASKIKDFKNLIILGRGQNWALAEEFALKIQETSYINAFGYPTGEFMHGHLAILDENIPVISLLTKTFDDSGNYKLAQKNTEEIKTKRNPMLITIGHTDSADLHLEIEDEVLTPFLTTLIIQLLSFKIASLLGKDVSNPRSLNKAVLNE